MIQSVRNAIKKLELWGCWPPCSSSCGGRGGPSGPLSLSFLSFCLFVFLSFCLFVFFVYFFCIFYTFFFLFVFFVFLSFYSFVFLYFCIFVFLSFCLFVFLSFCLFVTTILITGSISTTTPIFVPIRHFFNFHTFHHKPLPLLPPTPHNVFCT